MPPVNSWIAESARSRYQLCRHAMKYLTKEQQTVLCVVLGLLLTGLAVKTWRTAHPSKQAAEKTSLRERSK